MEGHCSTGQNPQWAVVPMEEEERNCSPSPVNFTLFSINFNVTGRSLAVQFTNFLPLLLDFEQLTVANFINHRRASHTPL